MTRHRTPEGELDLGDLITAAIGLDRSWVKRAGCLKWTDDLKPTPWQVDKSQIVDGVRGSELIKMALMVCNSCAVQWECAEFAVRGKMRAGTWAMGITNLAWLQDQEEWEDILNVARENLEPLHPLITDLRRA